MRLCGHDKHPQNSEVETTKVNSCPAPDMGLQGRLRAATRGPR